MATYRHKPHKDTRPTVTAVDIQQLVVDLRKIVPEGEQPLVKVWHTCPYCGSSKSQMIEHELWLDTYAPDTDIDDICYWCSLDMEEFPDFM